ncbi:acyl-CoA dehydrogenase family protein [Jatrophihabitans sp.]|uniref:acyl-CoA dehydrogenase family protein n=1 Tax=Jatrophihabitans sp. TaxID=1932789 RepID=UPI0030C69529|nr:Acyl-CoA dehydrogenase, long-chain specific [Jatrophihabitans sp.]
MALSREVFEPEHEAFRAVVRSFLEERVLPRHDQWEADGVVDRSVFIEAGERGVVGFNIPEEYGGGGASDFRFNAVVVEEMARLGVSGPGFKLHNDIVAPYLLTLASPEQQQRWLPDFAAGRSIWAIAMTEPGTGSDLRGIRTRLTPTPGGWRLNGAKTFISNGILSDHVIVVARGVDAQPRREISLVVVHRDSPGFARGSKLEKIGLRAQDTAELFFDDVFVPEADLLGTEGGGFAQLMHNLPLERLSMAINAVATSKAVFEETLTYTRERKAFGQPIASFQNSRFRLAEIATELDITGTYIDRCIQAAARHELSAVDAAKAKWWATEMQQRVVTACLQLHGGYGFMKEFRVARAFVDGRVQTIYGGTTEIMKEIIGRDLGA